MSGSYRQCGQCGKRALSFATRCPGCGIALPDPLPFDEASIPSSNRFLWVKVGMAVAASGVMLALLAHPGRPAPLGAETSFVKPVAVKRPPVVEAVLAVTSSPAAKARPDAPGVPLIAKGWTHVRSSRTVNSTLEAVLTPGDTVVCDSLVNGWYRVALYGDVLGYAREDKLSPATP